MENETIKLSELEDVKLGDVDFTDYPDMSDAYVVSASWKKTGEPLTEDELDRIDEGEIAEYARETVITVEMDRDFDMER